VRWQQAVILVIIAAALAFYVYYSEINVATSTASLEEIAARARKVFYGFDADAVDAVVIKRAGEEGPQELAFAGAGGAWVLRSPVSARADASEVRSVVAQLVGLVRMGTFEIPQASVLGDYGLDAPAVTVTLAQGERSKRLLLGNADPTSAHVYASEAAAQAREVFLVDAALVRELRRPLRDWRDTRVIPVPADTVASLTLSRAGAETISLSRKGRDWTITSPLRARARADAAEALVERLTAFAVHRERGFVGDGQEAITRWGLDRPSHTLTVADAAGRSLTVRLTRAVDPDDPDAPERLVAAASDYPSVMALPSESGATLATTLLSLRDRRIMGMDVDDVTAFEIQSPRGEIALVRGDRDVWRIARPQAASADGETVRTFLTELRRVGIARFQAAEDATLAGVAPGRAAVTLTGRSGEDTERIVFGDPVEESADEVYLTTSGNEDIVAARVLPELLLPESALAFRDRTVIDVHAERIERFDVRKRERTYRVDRDGFDWRVGAPVKAEADRDNAERLVKGLAKLRVARFVEENVEDIDRFGLDAPRLAVALHLERMGDAPRETIELHVGIRRGREEHYASITSGPGLVFTIDQELYDAFDAEMCRRDILLLDSADLTSIAIGPLKLVRDDGSWKIADAAEGEALNRKRIAALLEEFEDLKARRFAAFEADAQALAKYGVEQGSATKIELVFKDPSRPDEILLLGNVTADRGRYARLAGDSRIFELSPATTKKIALRRRDLVTKKPTPTER